MDIYKVKYASDLTDTVYTVLISAPDYESAVKIVKPYKHISESILSIKRIGSLFNPSEDVAA